MSTKYDFKKEWEKTRLQLAKFSKEAVKIAKKGEKELVEFTRRSRLRVDSTAISLKKEKLYYLIGKEYANTMGPDKVEPKLQKLVDELNKANKRQLALKRRLNTSKK